MAGMTAEIISVGTELLLGQIANTDAQFLSRKLSEVGIALYRQQVVGDNAERLKVCLREACSRSDIVILTGGLGPTDDDITKTVVAQFAGVRLVEHKETAERIRDYFQRTRRAASETNLRQAMLPEGAAVFPNDYGTAPGCAVEYAGRLIILLPGPPRELQPMFEQHVLPLLRQKSGNVIYSRFLRVFGIPESKLQEELGDLMQGENPTLSPYAKQGEVELRITARAEDETAAATLCDPLEEEIRRRVGDAVYTDEYDSLQQTVVALLRERGETVGVAESCTGGLVAERLTQVPGASEVFGFGACTYAPQMKRAVLGVNKKTLDEQGVVSPETAVEMAEGARRRAGATIGVGLTGVAGPDGGTEATPVGTVFVALSDGKNAYVRELHVGRGGHEREHVRYVASSHALDMVRLFAQEKLDAIGEPYAVPKLDARLVAKGFAANYEMNKPPLLKRFLGFFTSFPKDPWQEKLRKGVLAVSSIVLVVSLAILGMNAYEMWNSDRINQMLSDIRGNQVSEEVKNQIDQEKGEGVQNWAYAWLEINPDTVGNIQIKDTAGNVYDNFDYPVVQTENNEDYLEKDFFGNHNSLGTAFLDYRCDVRNLSKNNIIYGHSTRRVDKMFNRLHQYKELDFLNSHPVIDYNTIYQDYAWKIYSVYITPGDNSNGDMFNYIRTDFSSDEDFAAFVQETRDRSLYDTQVDVLPTDKILTLSTCTYEIKGMELRLVIHARLVREGESREVAAAVENPDPVYFDSWYQYYNIEKPGDTSSQGGTSSQSGTSSGGAQTPTDEEFILFDVSIKVNPGQRHTFYVPYINGYGTDASVGLGEKQAEHGEIGLLSTDNKITYTADRGYTGIDTFTIAMTDQAMHQTQATVTVYIGIDRTTGTTLEVDEESVTCSANGGTVTAQIQARSNDGGNVYYRIMPGEGLYSGTATVDANGLVTYQQTSDRRYEDFVKVVAYNDRNSAKVFYLTINDGYGQEDEEHPTVSRPTTSTAPPTSSAAPPVSSDTSSAAPPASSTTPPVSSETPPVSSTTPPASSETPPVSSDTSSETPPASSETPPVSSETPPVSSGGTASDVTPEDTTAEPED